MTVPLQITFKDMDASAALEERIRAKAAKLSRFGDGIQNCRVTIAAAHGPAHPGRVFETRIEILVPRGEIVVNQDRPVNHAHTDAHISVRDAFETALRQLDDHFGKLNTKEKRGPAKGDEIA